MSDTVRPPKPPAETPTPEQKFAARGTPRSVADANTRLRARVRKVRKFPTRPVAVRLQIRLWEAIDRLAEHFDVDRTQVVKRLFEDGLRKYGTKVEGLLESCDLTGTRPPNPFDAFAQMQTYDDPSFLVPQQPSALMFGAEQFPQVQQYATAPAVTLGNVRALPGVVLPQGGGNLQFATNAPEEDASGE